MAWSQLEAINKVRAYWKNQYTENLEKSSKLPFYNIYPYKPSKETLRRLKESVKDIKFN